MSRVSRSASEVTLRASPGPAAVGFRESRRNHWGILLGKTIGKWWLNDVYCFLCNGNGTINRMNIRRVHRQECDRMDHNGSLHPLVVNERWETGNSVKGKVINTGLSIATFDYSSKNQEFARSHVERMYPADDVEM